MIEGESGGGAAIGVARHLVEQDDQCQPSLGTGAPTREVTARRALQQGLEARADLRVACRHGGGIVSTKPESHALLEPRGIEGRRAKVRAKPEFEHVVCAFHEQTMLDQSVAPRRCYTQGFASFA